MPLIDVSKSVEPKKTGIDQILKESGILKEVGVKGERSELSTALAANGLGLSEVLSRVRELSENGETDNVRLGANKMALEMHGALRSDNAKQIPTVNITIIDSASVAVNPILLPR